MKLFWISAALILSLVLLDALPADHHLDSILSKRNITGAVPRESPCPGLDNETECPNIFSEGFPCADCMRATGEDLTLTAERDPLFPPYPSRPANETSSFSRECRWSIRFYLHALAPDTSTTPRTMTRMCGIIVKWGPMTIVCIKDQFPEIAYQFFGQLVRCEFAMVILGSDWGTEKAEESIFIDAYTNRTARAADFITEGFPPMPDGSRRSLKEEAPLLLPSHTVV